MDKHIFAVSSVDVTVAFGAIKPTDHASRALGQRLNLRTSRVQNLASGGFVNVVNSITTHPHRQSEWVLGPCPRLDRPGTSALYSWKLKTLSRGDLPAAGGIPSGEAGDPNLVVRRCPATVNRPPIEADKPEHPPRLGAFSPFAERRSRPLGSQRGPHRKCVW